MRHWLIGAVAVICAACIEPPTEPPIDQLTQKPRQHGEWTILVDRQAWLVLREGAIDAPQDVSGIYTPDSATIAGVEAQLASWYKLTPGATDVPLDTSHRQYAGFIRSGRQFIYVNGFPVDSVTSDPERWRSQAVVVEDGGRSYWSVEYDLSSYQFMNFRWNGTA